MVRFSLEKCTEKKGKIQENYERLYFNMKLPITEPNPSDYIKDDYIKKFTEWVEHLVIKTENGCWNWTGTINNHSGIARYKNQNANTYIYKRLNECPDYGKVLRNCKNPRCVNPEHSYHTVGQISRRKIKSSLRIDNKDLTDTQRTLLKSEMTEIATQAVTQALRETIRATVREQFKDPELVKQIVEGILIEMIRVRFDELIANKVGLGRLR